MDSWQAVQNWAIFGVAVGGLVWYYYPQERKIEKPQEKVKAREQAPALKQSKQHNAKRSEKSDAKVMFTPATTAMPDVGNDANDDNALKFAEQMMKARKGTTLKNADKADTRVKTVKQGSALRTAAAPSGPAPEVAEDVTVSAPATNAGDVADMLETVAPGPSSLRIAPSQQPVKEKASKQAKQETAETKKQRQNRQKAEAKKQQREEEEKERKALEEKQRRSAREARGEPAKNGITVAKPPSSNAWSSSNGSTKSASEATAATHGALLDTFEVESTSSSNAGASTAATSTTEGHQSHWTEDLPPEEEQIAAFKAQDDGWNEVKTSKKQKKKTGGDSDGVSTPVAAPVVSSKPVAPAPKLASNGKTLGFQALSDELDQSTNVDPNDVDNWAA